MIKVKGSSTSIAPITGSGATAATNYPVLEASGKMAEWDNNGGTKPALSEGWSYKSQTNFGDSIWQIYFTI